MVVATVDVATHYPLNWPTNPFHMGEVEVQKRLGVQQHVMSYAPKVVRPYMPDQHREFYQSQPFLVVAARDEHSNHMWSSLLFASDSDQVTSFVTSPDPTRLSMEARVLPGDALENALLPGSDLGMLGIEFAARRRNRVNGRLLPVSDENMASHLEFKVDHSFGNCPQYIKPRDWWTTTKESTNNGNETVENKQYPSEKQRSNQLSKAQIDNIGQAETIFVATGFRGEGDDPRFGNDASHRGGAPGFIKVEGSNKLLLPDYSGNNHYNTIGNLVMDSRMGITIPLFEYGGMIQLSGRAVVDWDAAAAAKFHGAKRIIEFTIDEIVELPPGSLPIQWASRDKDQLQVQVVEKVCESQDVTSFYLSAVSGDSPSLPLFLPGQHLPITLSTGNSEVVARTYSLSSSASGEYYRISVKRDPFGLASRYLHDEVHAGDVLSIQKPAGDFVYDQGSDRTLVLLSAGIGITPMLSMLHKFVEQVPASTKQAYWIHSARDAEHNPFRDEVAGLQKIAGDRLHSHVAFTKPRKGDTGHDSVGRIKTDLLKEFVVDLKNADVYMCGTDSFMANMGSSLEGEGIDPNHIYFESF
jgi:ferredoxin-NADP reductase/predicted pyridoxine 5'-phosphate oxidase superfamily flavin-nucleotide-binding protein